MYRLRAQEIILSKTGNPETMKEKLDILLHNNDFNCF